MENISEYFKKSGTKNIYNGEAIHILRNNKGFLLNNLFDTTKLKSKMTFYMRSILPGGTAYENLSFTSLTGSLPIKDDTSFFHKEYTLTANTNPIPINYITSTVIKVTIVLHDDSTSYPQSDELIIPVYIHSNIREIWLGPKTYQTHYILSGNMHFDVFARFDDNSIAKISHQYYDHLTDKRLEFKFYTESGSAVTESDYIEIPSTNWKLSIDNSNYNVNLKKIDMSIAGEFPVSKLPFELNSSTLKTTIGVRLKDNHILYSTNNFTNKSNSSSVTNGVNNNANIKLIDYGTTRCVSGDSSVRGLHNKFNFIILGNGFQLSEQNLFNEYCTQIADYLSTTNAGFPWNKFGGGLNVFSHFLPSLHSTGTLEGDLISLKNDSSENNFSCSTFEYIASIQLLIDYLKTGCIAKNSDSVGKDDKGRDVLMPGINSLKSKQAAKKLNDAIQNESYIVDLNKLEADSKTIYDLSVIPPAPISTQVYNLLNKCIGLEDIIKNYGLPTAKDQGISFANKIKQWRHFEGVYNDSYEFINPSLTNPKFRIFKDEDTKTFDASVPILYEFVFEAWRKMWQIVQYTNSETIFDIKYCLNKYDEGIRIDINNNDFDKFISGISINSLPLGLQFFDKSKTSNNLGKDVDNVIIIDRLQTNLNSGLTRGFKSDDLNGNVTLRFCSLTHSNTIHNGIRVKNLVGSPSYITTESYYPTPTVSPSILPTNVLNVVIHEIGHPTLGDEYANSDSRYKRSEDLNIQATLNYANLQIESDLEVSGVIDYNLIRWNKFPRIAKIAVSNTDLVKISSGSSDIYEFHATFNSNILLDEPKRRFDVGDVVLLRHRLLSRAENYFRFRIESVEVKNLSVITTPPYITKYVCYTISLLGTTPLFDYELFNYNDPNKGGILIKPFWKNPLTFDDYKTMISSSILQAMIDNNRPLWGDLSANESGEGHNIQFPSSSLTSLINPPPNIFFNYSLIVGLYSGGNEKYGYGIYHPAGFCRMRASQIGGFSAPRNSYIINNNSLFFANSYCPVCQYILVDKYDPTRHPDIDEEYENIYPE